MEMILETASELIKNFKQTDAFLNYCKTKNEIENDDYLFSELNRYKQEHIAFQNKIKDKAYVSLDDEKQISRLYWKLMLNEKARIFLESEKTLVETLNKVYNIIGDLKELKL